MNAPRFFVGSAIALVPGEEVALPDAVARHAVRVLRLAAGAPLVMFDGRGGEYASTLTRIERRAAFARVERHDAVERESPLDVTLAQAVLAADAMDFAVRKSVELGVAKIVPLLAERSQRLPAGDRAPRRVAHWQSIAIAACEQCGRNRIPDVVPPVTLAALLDALGEGESIAMAGPGATRSLAELAARATPRTLVIGPEGGFTDGELHEAARRGVHVVHLGPRILRAETAAIAALATLAAIAGDAR